MSRTYTLDDYEIVDDADGHPVGGARAVNGPVPPAIAALLAQMAGPLVRGREARTLHLLLSSLGYLRDEARARAVLDANEPALNAYLSQLNLTAVARAIATDAAEAQPGLLACATDPGAALPLFGTGALAGFVLAKLFDGQ